jgi:hypothetical protein
MTIAVNEPAYHLLLDAEEATIVGQALRLLISDEAHEPGIRTLAREVLELLGQPAGPAQASEDRPSATTLTIPLKPEQMKIAHTAVRLLLDDTQRGQESERRLLWAILEKLPDEHSLRAIELG